MSGWFGGFKNINPMNVVGGGGSGKKGRGDSDLPIDQILEKIKDTTNDQELRESIHQLSTIGRNSHQIVGSKMSILTATLSKYKSDVEIVRDIIEILALIMTCSPKEDNIIEIHNTELFISDKNNFNIICDLLSQSDYYVRYFITRLLHILITNRLEGVQETILSCPMSLTNIMSLLSDSREMIRNETLLVILELTKSNQEIQKIVAFESAFEILLEIIRKEGQSEGGVVVNDCIQILLNLLKGNVSNQNFFRETGCIPRLSPLLEVQNTDMWILSDNKFTIITSTLELILVLVERNNLSTLANQHHICQCGMMNLIIRLGLGKMSSQVIRSKSLYTLGEVIHQNPENITEFAGVSIKSEVTKHSQSALLRLTMVMLYSKDLAEKVSSFHVFKCYLSSNEEAQLGLASTLISSSSVQPNEVHTDEDLSIGQHLLRALFSWESPSPSSSTPISQSPLMNRPFDLASFWYSSVVLQYMLIDSTHTKDHVLKAPLEIPKSASDASNPPATLFTKLMSSLLSTKKVEVDPLVKIGLLKLLSIWLDHSPKSIKAFFENQSHISFIAESVLQPITNTTSTSSQFGNLQSHIQGLCTLILGICVTYLDDETAEANRSNLNSIILHRIGVNNFKDKLDSLRKSDAFTHSEQGEESYQSISEKTTIQLYDLEYTLFFKEVYDKIRHIGTNVNKLSKLGSRSSNKDKDKEKDSPPTSTSSSPPITSPPPISKHQQSTSNIPSPSLTTSTPTTTMNTTHLENEIVELKKNNQELVKELTSSKSQLQQLQMDYQTTQQQLQQLQLNQSFNISSAGGDDSSNLQIQQLQQQLQQQQQQMEEHTKGLQGLVEDKEKEIGMLSEANYKLEDLVLEKDDSIEDLKKQIEFYKNKSQQQQQASPVTTADNSNVFNFGGNDNSGDIFELARLRQESQDQANTIQSLESQLNQLNQTVLNLTKENQLLQQQKEEALKKILSSPSSLRSAEPNGLRLAKVEGELSELKIKYDALVKDQDELLNWSAKLELENQSLKMKQK
eukprot:gene3220-4032_t